MQSLSVKEGPTFTIDHAREMLNMHIKPMKENKAGKLIYVGDFDKPLVDYCTINYADFYSLQIKGI